MKILFLDVDGVLNMDADFVLPLSPPNNGYKVFNKNFVCSMEKFVVDNDIIIVWFLVWGFCLGWVWLLGLWGWWLVWVVWGWVCVLGGCWWLRSIPFRTAVKLRSDR